MNFKLTKDPLEKSAVDIIFVVGFEKKGDKPVPMTLGSEDGGRGIDRLLEGQLSQILHDQEFTGKEGATLLIPTFGKISAKHLLIVGLGPEKNFSPESARRLGGAVASAANKIKAMTVAGAIENRRIKGSPAAERLQAFVEGAFLSNYRFNRFKRENGQSKVSLETLLFSAKGNTLPLEKACEEGKIFAEGANLAREWTNRPGNDATPTALAKTALEIARSSKNISCKVLGLQEIKKQKMGALLCVTQGSEEPPAFIHLSYKPPKKPKMKIVLVGKGITFDSGGLNIKTREQELMKFDMAGSAAVLGVFHALARLKWNVAVEGLIAACENLPSGTAVKPGDIIKTRSGKTVEIINTDAEGRLVLADALDYADELKPDLMIDMATLTGGAAYALGELITPVLGNDKRLVEKIIQAGKKAGEPAWELPIVPEYKKGYLKGPADLKNSGSGTKASTIAGALFLEEFVKENKWAHMDIASTGWADEPTSYYTMVGATGNPVRTLLYFLKAES